MNKINEFLRRFSFRGTLYIITEPEVNIATILEMLGGD